jgi:sugar/nucleoside kinase (ribokinase family)
MRSALIAGHICVDLIPTLSAVPTAGPGKLTQIGPLRMSAGGCVSNTGATLAALGAPVTAVADAGDDELGAALLRLLTDRGMATDGVRLEPGRSTSYTIVLEPAGRDRAFWHHLGANAEFDGVGLDLAGADLLHVGYPPLLPALAESGGERLEGLLVRAHRAGLTTSLDLAVLDPDAPAAREDWPALLAQVLPSVDVLTPSVDDLRTTLGWDLRPKPADLRRAAHRLVEMGVAVVLVTGGSAGAQLCTAPAARLAEAGAALAGAGDGWGRQEHAATAPDVPVRTTVGAGDAATAGLLYGVLAGLGPQECLRTAMEAAGQRVAGLPVRPGRSGYDGSSHQGRTVQSGDTGPWPAPSG